MIIILKNYGQAKNAADLTDAELGFPWEAVDRGPGRHPPKALTRTLRWAVPRKHPTTNDHALPAHGAIEYHRPNGSHVRDNPGGKPVVLYDDTVGVDELNGTWFIAPSRLRELRQ